MSISLLLLLVPLLCFVVLGLAGHKISARIAGLTGTAGMCLSAILACGLACRYFFVDGKSEGVYRSLTPYSFEWLRFSGSLHIDLGIFLHPVSVMMLVVITLVSSMVHIYSLGYMRGEKGFQRYYAFLSLFTFSMLGLVVATNIFQMYIFWELVGVSSYLLIGFYYTRPAAIAASKKAFIVTRFADLGFLVGVLLLSFHTKTFDFAELTAHNAALVVDSATNVSFMGLSAASWAMGLIFVGGAGKSAMFPLHVWLPDAMEGPTPVSSLIHAATMVVAGVYMIAVLFPVYSFAAPDVLAFIGYVGAFTALFAALIAIAQTDVKRALAFSTISQIAYMMTALGVATQTDGTGYTASMFHLFTHAFFKALLFLCAGALIHAVGSNDIGKMGNLRKYMPLTHLAFLISCLAIAGIPPFSGFFSKDEILTAAFNNNRLLFVVLLIVALLTAFYMFRLYYRIFAGNSRNYEHPPHKSPPTMRFAMAALAIFVCVSGLVPFSQFIGVDGTSHETHINPAIAAAGVVAALSGIVVAALLYRNSSGRAAQIAARFNRLHTMAANKFYIDEIWIFFTKTFVFGFVARPLAWFDKTVIDGVIINGAGRATEKIAHLIKGLQSGQIQFYAFIFVFGTLFITIWILLV
ncbi:MAG: NADH-quinone oxidoreductase subunit L [Prevotellaceae bacterium]|nr:NADH-quinone oxidoreductase subunit L [Prevotellaceae bacterium]